MKKHSVILSVILCLSLTVSLTACSGKDSGNLPLKPVIVKAQDLVSDYTRSTQEEGIVTEEFTNAFSNFGLRLFNEVVKDSEGNKLISPLSAYVCLAMALNGADNMTKTQLENVLGMKTDELNRALYAYTSALPDTEEVKVRLANSLWMRDTEELVVEKTYLQTLADWFSVQVYKEAFDDATVDHINSWCADHTDGMIDKIMDAPISANDMLYLINALVFDGKWSEGYEEYQISHEKFRNRGGTETEVSMLNSTEDIYLSSEDTIGFMKAYKDEGYYFVGLLPKNENADIYEFASGLTGEKWQALFNTREYRSVMAKIPEFKVRDEKRLKNALKKMGAVDMFDYAADFKPLGHTSDDLYVTEVNQFTYLELDRNGTKAAAVTGITMANKAVALPEDPIPEVFLDRPFVYMIVDSVSGLPLFIGITDSL